MVERTSFQPQFPCFGLEQISGNSKCLACSEAQACASAMMSRFGRVPVHKAKFKLVPAKLEFKVQRPESFEYARAFSSIFGQVSPAPQDESLAACVQNAKRVTKDFYLFCLVNMWAHQQVNPEKQFWPSMMAGQAGVNRFKQYQDDVVKTMGSMSRGSFGEYAVIETQDSRLTRSEICAGTWIIGYKMRNSGPAFEHFIQAHELDLDDEWLATTPEYEKFLLSWLEKKSGTEAQVKKRNSALRTLGILKRTKSAGAQVFATREAIMPQVIVSVLQSKGYQPETFLVKEEPWSCTIKFWSRLALALQHIKCLNYVKRQSKTVGLEKHAQIRMS